MNGPTILILGTDAAGKNYLGQLLLKHARAKGLRCAFRERRLSGRDNGGLEKEKSALGHWSEWAFIKTYPTLQSLMPFMVKVLLRVDIALSKPNSGAQIIVSHNALRLAAYDCGHRYKDVSDIEIPARTKSLLRELKNRLTGNVIVLDISHETRIKRVNSRGDRSDPMDRYLVARPVLSERIEACMVRLALEYLDATLIENNGLSDTELLNAVLKASPSFAKLINANNHHS